MKIKTQIYLNFCPYYIKNTFFRGFFNSWDILSESEFLNSLNFNSDVDKIALSSDFKSINLDILSIFGKEF